MPLHCNSLLKVYFLWRLSSNLLQDNPGCGDCVCDHRQGMQTNQSCCTCIQGCRCPCSSGGGVVSHCCPCECPCFLGLVQSTGVQVCNPCGCACGVCENGVGGLKCCNCPFSSSGSCFPTTARVNLEGGKSVTMSELQIGDRVQTGKDIKLILNHISKKKIQQREIIES